MKLERLGLAVGEGLGRWSLRAGAEDVLRALGDRGDIIKTLHRAMSGRDHEPVTADFAIHGNSPHGPVVGRLVARGLHNELTGAAYAIVDGVDGRTHHLTFGDLEMTGDCTSGAIVEARVFDDKMGRPRVALATRSDIPIEAQVTASGATWLDRRLLAPAPEGRNIAFGAEVQHALDRRVEQLVSDGLARRHGQKVIFAGNLLNTLRRRELEAVAGKLSQEIGLPHQPSAEGETVAGVYRRRLTLSSGRFAMIDDGIGFQLIPWRSTLEKQIGREVAGVMTGRGSVFWRPQRVRELGL